MHSVSQISNKPTYVFFIKKKIIEIFCFVNIKYYWTSAVWHSDNWFEGVYIWREITKYHYLDLVDYLLVKLNLATYKMSFVNVCRKVNISVCCRKQNIGVLFVCGRIIYTALLTYMKARTLHYVIYTLWNFLDSLINKQFRLENTILWSTNYLIIMSKLLIYLMQLFLVSFLTLFYTSSVNLKSSVFTTLPQNWKSFRRSH